MTATHIENTGRHLHSAINSVRCGAHGVPVGVPCYTLDNTSGLSEHPFHYGICGQRIRSAGYVGKISPESMRKRPPARKSTSGERKPFIKKHDASRQPFAGK